MTDHPATVIDLRHLSTPRERCLSLQTGKIDAMKVDEAETNRFDQIPVIDSQDRLCGIISTKQARSMLEESMPIGEVDHGLSLHTVDDRMELFELLEVFGAHRAVVFRRSPEDETHDANWFALVTLSDLNRHPFRAYLYPLFAALEAYMAELIDLVHRDPWEWFKWTSPHSRPTIIGRWELEKKDSIDSTAVSGCEFRDLMLVIQCSKRIRRQLHYDDVWFKKMVQVMSDLRNDVMHPVRALVRDEKGVRSLREKLRALTELSMALDEQASRINERLANSFTVPTDKGV